MIKQCAVTDIESRSECNPYDSTGFLPLIVAPMYSCIDKHNAHVFLDNKIKVCMPRKEYMDETYTHCSNENYFDSYSLEEFVENFINSEDGFLNDSNYNKVKTSVCIDTAAGHLKKLHDAVRKAKDIHGDKLVIMAGNVSSVEAFVELATTGVDYIRVGIGGGGGCNTTSNTGVGQKNLYKLIKKCNKVRQNIINNIPYWKEIGVYKKDNAINPSELEDYNTGKIKIVADGISSYIKFCEKEYGFNDNGYAAINKLLCSGANLVMVGSLFAQCVESAGEKGIFSPDCNDIRDIDEFNTDMGCDLVGDEYKSYEEYWNSIDGNTKYPIMVKYAGMSTQAEQKKYKELELVIEKDENLDVHHTVNKQNIKPSEGSVKWIPVRWTLQEWLYGSDNQDEYPYLMGWINSIKSAMSYLGTKNL